jgi:hypothetical protein
MDDFYNKSQITLQELQSGNISEKEKLLAAKQILLGLALLYVLTLVVYLIRPVEGERLLEICTTTFPPLATLILVAYFKDRPVQ